MAMKTIEDAYELLNDIARLSGHTPFVAFDKAGTFYVNCNACRDLMYTNTILYAPLLMPCGQSQNSPGQLAIYRSEQYRKLKTLMLEEYGWEVV